MKDLKAFEWLIGQWEGIQESGAYHESWEKITEEEFQGRAYMLMKGEIKNVENLKLRSAGDEIYYVAEVGHNPEPVSFKLINSNESLFVFENSNHDFPQKITYEKKDKALLATIEATENGKIKKVEFRLKLIAE